MSKREIVKLAYDAKPVPYVPWSCEFTVEAAEKLQVYFNTNDLDTELDNHYIGIGDDIDFFKDLGNDCYEDIFKVVWDRSTDKDTGIVKGCVFY